MSVATGGCAVTLELVDKVRPDEASGALTHQL